MLTEDDVNKEYDNWVSEVSRYVVSRSSRVLSPETQNDGRILLTISAVTLLVCVGIVKVTGDGNVEDMSFTIDPYFFPLIMQLVCLYFLFSFIIEAYSDRKAWQFRSQIRNSPDEDPFIRLKREKEEIKKDHRAMADKYEDLRSKAMEEMNSLDKDHEDTYERIKELEFLIDGYNAAQELETREIDIRRQIFSDKIKMYELEVVPLVRSYNRKRLVNLVFPLFLFVLSILATIYFYATHAPK